MSVRISSAPMRSAIEVEPTTSAKSTVTSFRSPSSAARLARMRAARCAGVYDDGDGVGVGGGGVDDAPGVERAGAPQRSQNAASAGSAAPQPPHTASNGAPHARQKRASSRFSFPHRSQRTATFYVVLASRDNRGLVAEASLLYPGAMEVLR